MRAVTGKNLREIQEILPARSRDASKVTYAVSPAHP